MAKRILVLDNQEYDLKAIKQAQAIINEAYVGIYLMRDTDKLLAICDIEYSYEEVCSIFGEAYISIGEY